MTAPSSSGQRKASTSRHLRLQRTQQRAEAESFNSLFATFVREKAKWKERDEAWLKIGNLAKSNPQVLALPSGIKATNVTANIRPSLIQSCLFELSYRFLSAQFLMYHDSAGPERPVDMETDGPLLDDVSMLKKTVQEEATEVRRSWEEQSHWCASWLLSRFFESLSSHSDPEGAASRAPADAEEIRTAQRHLHRHGLGAAPASRGHAHTRRPVRPTETSRNHQPQTPGDSFQPSTTHGLWVDPPPPNALSPIWTTCCALGTIQENLTPASSPLSCPLRLDRAAPFWPSPSGASTPLNGHFC